MAVHLMNLAGEMLMRYFVYLNLTAAPITDGRSSLVSSIQQCLEDSLFLLCAGGNRSHVPMPVHAPVWYSFDLDDAGLHMDEEKLNGILPDDIAVHRIVPA